MAKFDFTSDKKLRKIPILITKEAKNKWRAEISDNYENYKPIACNEVNFEDLDFHFEHKYETRHDDAFLFYRKIDAVECAKYINEKYLNNKGKIWNCK